MNEKITPGHLQRKAVLYIRQSSPHQVTHHLEGKRLQYAMKERLQQLGWPAVEVIDEDLGRSASGTAERTGFERMVAEVSLGRVGVVAAREVSRFARNSRDWQQLIEVCRIVDTLLIDHETIYDPRRSNDRLLLGLKGSLNEYELDLLRHRAHEARKEKAQRGELMVVPPVGFFVGEGGYEKDPDLRVQEGIKQVFAKFFEFGSVRQVLFWFVEHGLQLPTRRHTGGHWETWWRRPNYAAVYRILTNPIYAGAYAYGRAHVETVWKAGVARKVVRRRPTGQWPVLLSGRHEGYIDWEQFQRIQRMIADNVTGFRKEAPGAVRVGAGLLAGLLRCRRCGQKLRVHYTGREENVLRYNCCRGFLDKGQPRCINFGGALVDDAVAGEVLRVLRPAAVEAALQSAAGQSQRQDQLIAALDLEMKSAHYAAERARRQYDAADPENRLVADELERRWNKALERVSEIEARITRQKSQHQIPDLPPAEAFVSLASDLETLWHHPNTDVRLKKRIIRSLLEEVVADVCSPAGEIRLTLHWQGGIHTELSVRRRRRGQNGRHTAAPIVEAVQVLTRIAPDDRIAAWLNRNQLKTGQGNYWTEVAVASLRSKRGISKYSAEGQQVEGWMTLTQAARFLGISTLTLRIAIDRKEIQALHPLPDGPWIIKRQDLEGPKAKQLIERVQHRRDAQPDSQQLFP
jgi:DNA invertase Pin-like site-specific DNA recombinase